MPGEVFIRPRARQDLVEQALYIAEASPEAADRFVDAIENSLATLADMPEMGAPRDFNNVVLLGIRMWPVKGFEKHLIFYRPVEGGIEVIRVLHAARDLESLMNQDEW